MLKKRYTLTTNPTISSMQPKSLPIKSLLAIFFALFLCINNAHSQDPIITMTTIKKTGTAFAFRLRAIDNDTTVVKVDFGNGILTEFGVGSTFAALIKGTLAGPNLKVYGMGSKIKLIGCYSMEITALDVSKDTALVSLLCYNNLLTSLDVSKNEYLKALQCHNNLLTFATLPLPNSAWSYDYSPQQKIVLPQKDYSSDEDVDLKYLSSMYVTNTKFTWKTEFGDELVSGKDYIVSDGVTHFLTNQIDSVYCEMTHSSFPQLTLKTSEIKVTKNIPGAPVISMETVTNVGDDFTFRIKANADTDIQVDFGDGHRKSFKLYTDESLLIDEELTGPSVQVYGTPSEIIYFNCESNNITKLDVSEATYLRDLDCSYNKLTSLDIKDITDLTSVVCIQNNLTKLEFNDKANSILCSRNNLTFETLPLLPAWMVCVYAPQKPLAIAKSFGTAQVIDLNDQLEVNTSTTVYTWKTKGGLTLTEGTDYSIYLGRTTFLKPQADSVYCEMTNASFPDFKGNVAFTTTNTWITGTSISVISMTTQKTPGSEFNLTLQAWDNNTIVYIDYGNGLPVAKTIHSEETPIPGTLIDSNIINIYSAGMYYVDCSFNEITSIDISKNQELTSLNCYKNQLSSLDISQNTNITAIVCGDNLLTSFDISKNTKLTWLYLYKNQLTSVNLSQNTELVYLDVSYNLLSTLDVTQNTKLASFNCSNNNLTALDVSKNEALFRLECLNNKLTFATLPIRTMQEYRYAPQQPVAIAKLYLKGQIIDLSELKSAGNANTVYTIKTKEGTTLTSGTHYSIENGKITLLEAQTDSIYCIMANATFPYLKGTDALRTSYTIVSEVSKQSQTITFNALPDKHVNDAAFELTATASSGLPVTFTSSDPAVASISGTTVTIHNAGFTTITASQAGDNSWNSATAAQTLTINPVTGINEEKKEEFTIYPNPTNDILYFSDGAFENADVYIFNMAGVKVWSGVVKQQSATISELPAGNYILKMHGKNKKDRIIRFVKQ